LRKVERNSILFIWSADWANSRPSLTLLYRVKKVCVIDSGRFIERRLLYTFM